MKPTSQKNQTGRTGEPTVRERIAAYKARQRAAVAALPKPTLPKSWRQKRC